MAQWNTNVKHEPSSINNGNQYEKKDRVSREQLNALAENSFYAVNKSEEAIEKANSAFEGNGTLVTLNGENQTTWSADFAESERQKSKNLFNMNSAQLSGTATISINGNTLTVSNNGDYGYIGVTANVKPNTTYTLSRTLNIITSGHEDTGEIRIDMTGEGHVWLEPESSENYITFTTGDETEITMYFYVVPWGYTGTGAVEFSNIQLEEGSVVTDYQPYNGAIVHEKDIEDVEHLETIYDRGSGNSNINWGYTGGIPTGTTITNKDFTKYKKLIVWYYNGYLGGICEIPLNAESGHAFRGTHCGISWDGNVVFTGGCSLSVKDAKTTFSVEYFIYYNGISDTARVTKIMGVF